MGTDQRLNAEIPPHSAPGGVRDGIRMLQIVRFQIPHQKITERAMPDGCQPILITPDSINGINLGIMMEQKKPEKCELTFSGDVLRK